MDWLSYSRVYIAWSWWIHAWFSIRENEEEMIIYNELTIYDELVAAGIPIDSHESDLYVPVTKETIEILAKYPIHKKNTTMFRHQIKGQPYYDIPFAYQPFWDKKLS